MYLVYDKRRAAADFGVAPAKASLSSLPPSVEGEGWLDYRFKGDPSSFFEIPGRPSPVRMAIAVLQRAGVSVFPPPDEDDESAPMPRKYERWMVVEDSSVPCECLDKYRRFHPNNEEYAYEGLEIVSPIFSYDGDDWQAEIRKVLDALLAAFNDRSENDFYRLYAPDTAGLHVHVGVGEFVGDEKRLVRYTLPLRSLKNFGHLTTGFERITDELHSVDRIYDYNEYCRAPSRCYNVGRVQKPVQEAAEHRSLRSPEEQHLSRDSPSGETPVLAKILSEPMGFPRGIVAEALRISDSVFAADTNPSHSARAILRDAEWLETKLRILKDPEENVKIWAFKAAVVVDAIMQRAHSHVQPIPDFHEPFVAALYCRDDVIGERMRSQYIESMCNLLRCYINSEPWEVDMADSDDAEESYLSSGSDEADLIATDSMGRPKWGPTVLEWCEHHENSVQSPDEIVRHSCSSNRGHAYDWADYEARWPGGLPGYSCKGTIEFRQHRASLDSDEVIAWVEVTTSMLRFSHEKAITVGSLLPLVRQRVYDPTMCFDSFLRMIGVSEKTVGYYDGWLGIHLDHDVHEICEHDDFRTKEVEQLERAEPDNSRLLSLTSVIALYREQQKSPVNVMGAIRTRAKKGDYGLPDTVRLQLLGEKYGWKNYP